MFLMIPAADRHVVSHEMDATDVNTIS